MLVMIESGDGSGKSTLARALATTLEAEGHEVVLTREPGGSPKAEAVRTLILNRETGDNYESNAELLLFYAARLQHIHDTIAPALQAGKLVICDRFEVSTHEYQVGGQGADPELFAFLHARVVQALAPYDVPMQYVHCDVDPAIAQQRIATAKRDIVDVFDGRDPDFHERVRAGREAAIKAIHPMFVHHQIDAAQSPEAMLAETRTALGL